MKVTLFDTVIQFTDADGNPQKLHLYDLQDGQNSATAVSVRVLLREQLYGHVESKLENIGIESFMTASINDA